jgi:hypothetical protein
VAAEHLVDLGDAWLGTGHGVLCVLGLRSPRRPGPVGHRVGLLREWYIQQVRRTRCPASHPIIGRTGRRPALPAGATLLTTCSQTVRMPGTSQHMSVVSLQVLQAMLAEDIVRLVGPRAATTPTGWQCGTAARRAG